MNTIIPSVNPEKSLPQINVFDNADGNQCVYARELYERLEITDRFSRWFDSLLKYGFCENSDFWCVKTSTQQNQYGGVKELDDYSITIDMAKQICMLQRSDKGREYREYFLKLEKAWNTPEAVMARALQVANKTLEETRRQVEAQRIEIESLTPDAESWRAFAETDGSFSATNVAKCLGLKRDEVLGFLELRGYIMRERRDDPLRKGDYIGTALGIERGYIKNYIYTKGSNSWIHFHLTPKGMQRVEKAFRFTAPPTDDEIEMVNAKKNDMASGYAAYSIGRAE